MLHKSFFTLIAFLQEILLGVGIGVLLVVPILLAYFFEYLPEATYGILFNISLSTVFLVMIVRPLADLLPEVSWVRPLVILRKGFGVLSASIVVAIMLSRIMTDGFLYVVDFFALRHWSLVDGSILAPLGDLSALVLLSTSNKFSKRVLGKSWKQIQKLSYVYFYAGAFYEYLFLGQDLALLGAVIVSVLTAGAYMRNRVVKRTLATA